MQWFWASSASIIFGLATMVLGFFSIILLLVFDLFAFFALGVCNHKFGVCFHLLLLAMGLARIYVGFSSSLWI